MKSKPRRYRNRAKSNPAPKRNPPLGMDLMQDILPGFAAFATSRFVTRIATTQVAKRWPKVGKHAGAIAAVGTAAAAYLGAHRVKFLAPYHHPIVIGAALAAAQSLIQLYIPAIGWMVSDATPGTLPAGTTVTATLTAAQQQQQAALQTPAVPDGFDEVDANSWFSYNDAFDAGSYHGKQAAPAAAPQASPTSSNAPSSAQSTMDPNDTSDLLDNSDLGLFS